MMNETHLKSTIKDYLGYMGIFSFPIVQGLGSYRGAPDRVMHFKGKAHYLEIKLPTGKMSEYQLAFQEVCKQDRVPYHVIKSLEDIQAIVGAVKG